MTKNRLEAFSDGIVAIVITVLVLNLTIPNGDSFNDLAGISQKIIVYIFSFSLVAIYWNNHHHLFSITTKIDTKIIWTNHFFLLALTMVPFATAWISEHLFSLIPQLLYGVTILLADFIYLMLVKTTIKYSDAESLFIFKSLARKTTFSILVNIIAISAGYFIYPLLISIINLLMISLWVIPDKRIEAKFNREK
ncbi:TMEM175 family protein [Vagococcus vulneris]|uniref:DUF1211 domain-containing membrane protein n=1 Tax=Vagococcus vulneris TaxID=1977869 RepID=A0A430A091_9ENTE|nr:TMEM175 family protein [Vagococcus vulneris]RST99753.1 hypothetical protein CBF37_03240 [Vagococcus vulneris]